MAYPKVDFKGLEKEVASARAVMSRCGGVYALKLKDSGFTFRGAIDERIEDMIEIGDAELIGFYRKPLRTPDLVEDLLFTDKPKEGKAA